jgi:hypothetical protein
MEQRWNNTDGGKPKYWKKNLAQCNLSTTDVTRAGLGSNPSHGIARQLLCFARQSVQVAGCFAFRLKIPLAGN